MDAILVLAGIVFLIGILTYFDVKNCKKRIRKILSDKGATDINVSWQWIESDSRNNVYAVAYSNKAGKWCQISCKVAHFYTLSNGDIYWSEPPEV